MGKENNKKKKAIKKYFIKIKSCKSDVISVLLYYAMFVPKHLRQIIVLMYFPHFVFSDVYLEIPKCLG